MCGLLGFTHLASAQALPTTPLTYDAVLQLASTRNLGVAAARRQRDIREAALRTAGLRPNPDVTFDAGRDSPHESLSLDWPVEFGGTRDRRLDLAKEELSLAELDVQAELRSLRRNLRESFYSLLAADERVRIAESVLDITQRLRDAAQSRFETGAAPRLEVLQADLAVVRAETDVDLARSLRISAQAKVNSMLDFPPQQTLAVTGALADRTTSLTFESAMTIATTTNIDLIRFDRQIAIEARRVALLKAERTPPTVFSFGGLFNAPGEFTAGVRGGVTIGIPIFSRNQGELAASIATTSQLTAARESMKRVVENDVFAAVSKIDAQRRQIDAFQQRLIPNATELASLSEESYRAGRISVLGVLEAQRALREMSQDALQASLDLQLSLAELEELLGTLLA